ncbi:PaaI family thioesterase [Rathayibacter sp. AY1C2]|uniref:PaaI family thioesterase n=1 Tax=Rathayibacter sp. AY1C2 TaxID=2080535 RepID=UPI0035BE6D72
MTEPTPTTTAWIRPPALDLVAGIGRGMGELAERMGILWHELTPQHSVASMPVQGNRQPVGILHGGAHVVLAESMGSIAANVHAGAGRLAMGIELNASHSRSVHSGFVIATCDAIHLGSTLTTHEIVVCDQEGRRLSTVRITNIIRDAR